VFAANGLAAPFNGGSDGTLGSAPHVQVTCGAAATGDKLVISSLTLTGCHVEWQTSAGAANRKRQTSSTSKASEMNLRKWIAGALRRADAWPVGYADAGARVTGLDRDAGRPLSLWPA